MLLPQPRESGKVTIGIINNNAGTASGSGQLKRRRNNHAASTGQRELPRVAGVAEKSKFASGGLLKRRQAVDVNICIPNQSRIEFTG